MRSRPLRRLTRVGLMGLSALAVAAASAQAPAPRVTITLSPPERLTEGDRAAVFAEVRFEPPGTEPLLLTPTSEGTAVEVVRGRLLRSDADEPDADVLRFRIPIVARTPGASVLRARVQGFACDRRCRPVTGEASVVLHVERSATPPE